MKAFSQSVRYLCIALMAFAVVLSGAGLGHAQPRTGGQVHSAATMHHGAPSAETDEHAAHHTGCDQGAMSSDHCPTTPKSGAAHGCCVSACLTGFTTPDVSATPIRAASAESLPVRTDQAMASRALDELFKPPQHAA
tara:strand:- start:126 stop:536 length:411 start_codon:yes stop_codon:yes gene_type:complete